MLRLLLASGLALISHLYLLQLTLVVNSTTPPELISNSSVSVSLNSNAENQQNDAAEDLPEASEPAPPQPPESITPPPETAVAQAVEPLEKKKSKLAPQPIEELKPIKQRERIAPVAHKIKKVVKEQKLESVVESSQVVEEMELPDNIPLQPTDEKTNQKAMESRESSSSSAASAPDASSSSVTIEAKPLYQYNPKPEYPKLARRRGWEGVVMVLVEVTKEGAVASVDLHKSSGYKILDRSALRAVKSWRFLAGSIAGKRARMTVMIPVHFKLQS